MYKAIIDHVVILLFFTFFGVVLQFTIVPGRSYPCLGIAQL